MFKGYVLADTGAGTSIFCDHELISNIRKKHEVYRVRGIGGSVINVCLEGDTVFGTVGYHKQAGMNILSIGEILDNCVYIEIRKSDKALLLQMVVDGPVYIFNRIDNQFICNLSQDLMYIDSSADIDNVYSFIGVATVEERKKLFSRAEVKRAEEARELQRKMAFPSPGQLIKQLQIGKIDSNVTVNDVINGVYIFGKSLGECKGKTTAIKQECEQSVPIPYTGVRKRYTLISCMNRD